MCNSDTDSDDKRYTNIEEEGQALAYELAMERGKGGWCTAKKRPGTVWAHRL